MVGWLADWLVHRSVGRSFGVLLACLVDWLVCCGSGVWSMGQLATGSLIRLSGGRVGRCVGRLVCGRLEDWSVRHLVGRSVGLSL